MSDTSILLIYTGGTIGMRTDPATGTLKPFDFSDIYNEFPSLRRLNVNLEFYDGLTPIDSSNVTPGLWVQLAEIIRDNYSRYDGFVVLHGTDTMSYTASAMSFMLENLGKPVIFTGSQIPMGVLRTDGRENLITAIEIAAARHDNHAAVPEVAIYFQSNLFRANRATKRSAEQLNAFTSNNYPTLADVGVTINYNYQYIRQVRQPLDSLSIATSLCCDIVVIRLFPGITERTLRSMLNIEGIRGVVLETYGSGNAPTAPWFVNALQQTIARGVTVVNVTQCHGGAVAAIYETGAALVKAGVVSGVDMTTEAAVTKLMYVLGFTNNPTQVKTLMQTPIRGEFTGQ